MESLLEVAILSISKFGKVEKFGKHAPAAAIPLEVHSPVWIEAEETSMRGQLKLYRIRLSYRQRQQERVSQRRRDPKLAIRTTVTALRQRSGRRKREGLQSQASGFVGTTTREDKSGKEGTFHFSKEIPPLLADAVCCTSGSTDIFSGSL